VMGLHRLFWIPKDMAASQGVYLRYPAEEFYAILALESHRNQTILVGEDLGTVPPEVRPAMRRHGLYRMYVSYYELTPEGRQGLRPVPPNALASINTHDMPPFAAFWQGLDISDWQELGLGSAAEAQQELLARQTLKADLVSFLREFHSAPLPKKEVGRNSLSQREPQLAVDAPEVLMAILAFLGASRAWAVVVNLEDLWLETQPQNVPGTSQERPNWRRKAPYGLEQFSRLPQVLEILHEVNRLRKPRGSLG